MSFFIYKTKMGLIFNIVKKRSPPNDFFAPHFSFFGHLLPTVSYCSKLCTDKVYEDDALCHLTVLKKIVQTGPSRPEM